MSARDPMAQRSLKAALAVSALEVTDRTWLEGQLSDGERERLEATLAALGDQDLCSAADGLSVAVADEREKEDLRVRRLLRTSPTALTLVLVRAQPWLLGTLVNALGPVAVAGVVEHMTVKMPSMHEAHRKMLVTMAPLALPPALRHAVLNALEVELEKYAEEEAPCELQLSWWYRLISQLTGRRHG